MKLPRRQFLHLAAGAAALPAVALIAWAQAYPSRPVRLLVGFPAGGSAEYLKNGGNGVEAYKAACPKKVTYGSAAACATRLLKNAKIRDRLKELQAAAAEEAKITIEGQIAKLQKLITKAEATGQLSAAVSAVVAQSKLAGIWVEQSDSRNLNVKYVISDRPKTSAEWAKRFCGED